MHNMISYFILIRVLKAYHYILLLEVRPSGVKVKILYTQHLTNLQILCLSIFFA
jgi:hypothetical protein